MKQVIIPLMSLCFIACSVSRRDCVGTYVAKDNSNTIDTIVIASDGSYQRKLFDRQGVLIYQNADRWRFSEGRIVLSNFVVDEDELYPDRSVDLSLFSMDCSLIPEKEAGRLHLFYRQESGDHRYTQID